MNEYSFCLFLCRKIIGVVNMAGTKGFKQLKFADRLKIEALIKANYRIVEIAKVLHVHRSTIYNELKRGQYEHLNSDWTTEMRYSPDIAQQRCELNLKVRGTQLKIANDYEYANYLEHRILDDGLSPGAVLGEIKAQGRENEFKTKICERTLYSYIDKGIFLHLTNKDLPVKHKRKYRKVKRQQARASAGTSIDKRPISVNDREEFGHWEMDSVLGSRKHSKNTLVVLSERKTRQEIIFKVKNHSADEVVGVLNILEKKWGSLFPKVFKSITVDNGSEFTLVNEMEKSILFEGKRTDMYYCHPYSSWERGTNENINKMIRRKIPKGTNFDNKTDEEIQSIEDWINNYPRSIFGYHTAQEQFEKEIQKMIDSSA